MNEQQEQFKKAMEKNGFEVETYSRYFYQGYAVCTDDPNKIIRATEVPLQRQYGQGVDHVSTFQHDKRRVCGGREE